MPHATLKLIPGVDQTRTPTLNEAAISSCNLIRFQPDKQGVALPQKLGGWSKYYSSTVPGTPRALWAWQDAYASKYVAIGTTTSLYALNAAGALTSVAAQFYTVDKPVAVITTAGSSTVEIQDVNSNIFTGDIVNIETQISVGGLILFGSYKCTFVSPNRYSITAVDAAGYPKFATSTVSLGGVVAQFTTDTTKGNAVTVTLPDHGYAVNDFFPILITTTFNGVSLFGNYVIQSVPTSNTFVINASTSATASGSVYMNNGLAEYQYFISNTVAPSASGFGAGSFGIGTFGIGTIPTVGRKYDIVNVQPSTPSAGYVTYTIGDSGNPALIAPVPGTQFTVSGVTPSNYDSVNPFTAVSSAKTLFQATGSISGTVLTITAVSGGTIAVGMQVAGSGVDLSTTISSLGTGTGGVGTYNVSVSQTVTSTGLTIVGNTSTIVIASTETGSYVSGGTLTFTNYATSGASDWTLANWGEILISCPEGGGIYQWNPDIGVTSSSLIQNAPLVNKGMFIAMPQRQIVAYGSTFNGIQQPLLVRWCDIGNYNVWAGQVTNQAGSYTIPKGSKIVGGIQGPQQGLLWTDIGVWAMQYVSQPYIYQFNEIGTGCGLIGKKAAGAINGDVYWMGLKQFFRLAGGGVEPVPCPVWDVVFQNINMVYADNIRVAVNSSFNEISWFYPSNNSVNGENDSYVKLNVLINQWDYGTLNRSAWLDQSIVGQPLGTTSSGYLYQHETSFNADDQPMASSFRTGFFEMSEAEMKMFVDQIWPDMKWGYYNGAQGAEVKITFYVADYPDGPISTFGPYTMTNAVTYITPRFRGRLVSMEISSNDLNSFWRLGGMRYRLMPDGKF